MTNLILQLIGVISAICGLIVVNFLFVIYVSVKNIGGNLERRHVIVISGVAMLFFLGSLLLTALGA